MSDLVRMIFKLLSLFLVLQLSLAEPEKLKCKRESAKICQLDHLIWTGSQDPVLPDLSSKHTLVIRSGNIHDVSKNLISQLGNVINLQLGQLNIRSLYISPKWISLKAEDNRIFDLDIEELGQDGDHSFEDMDIAETDGLFNPSTTGEITDITTSVLDTTDVPLADGAYEKQVVNELLFLNLANNKLKSVKRLKHLWKLQELVLDGNQIECVEMDTFAGMRKLKKLSLAKNEISRILTNELTNFFAMEKLSLAFNQLKNLEIQNWKMLQLTQLDVSHNQLVRMDAVTLDQFVSLEKLAMANNSWHCDWLTKAMKDIDRTFVQLEDSQETCAKELYVVKGFCCSYFQQVEDEPANTQDRIKRIEDANQQLKHDLSGKVDVFQNNWGQKWESLHTQTETMLKPYKEMEERMLKDENSQAKKAIGELEKMIADCEGLLDQIIKANNENKVYTKQFTNLFHATLAEKNKLMQEMSKAATLEEDMKNYEMSLKLEANN